LSTHFKQYLGDAGFSVLLVEKYSHGVTLNDVVLIYQNITYTVNFDLKVKEHGVTRVTNSQPGARPQARHVNHGCGLQR